jgi:hypothetical protein
MGELGGRPTNQNGSITKDEANSAKVLFSQLAAGPLRWWDRRWEPLARMINRR